MKEKIHGPKIKIEDEIFLLDYCKGIQMQGPLKFVDFRGRKAVAIRTLLQG